MSDELAAAVDEVLGGWEVALETRGAILPHNLKAWEQVEDYLTSKIAELEARVAELEALVAHRDEQIVGAKRALRNGGSRGKVHHHHGEDGQAYKTVAQGQDTAIVWLNDAHPKQSHA